MDSRLYTRLYELGPSNPLQQLPPWTHSLSHSSNLAVLVHCTNLKYTIHKHVSFQCCVRFHSSGSSVPDHRPRHQVPLLRPLQSRPIPSSTCIHTHHRSSSTSLWPLTLGHHPITYTLVTKSNHHPNGRSNSDEPRESCAALAKPTRPSRFRLGGAFVCMCIYKCEP